MLFFDERELPLVQRHLDAATKRWADVAPRYREDMEDLARRGRALEQAPLFEARGYAWTIQSDDAERVRRRGVEELFGQVWAGREAMRRIRDEVFEEVATGAYRLDADVLEPAQALVAALRSRKVPDEVGPLVRRMTERWYANSDPRFPSSFNAEIGHRDFHLACIVYEAAVQLRAAQRLEECYTAFSWSRGVWYTTKLAATDAKLPVRGRPSDYGYPVVHREADWVRWKFPDDLDHGDQVPWSSFDHVVGCGTTVREPSLERLGVPKHMWHVIEVHRDEPLLRLPIPRLRGRVVIVDDMHEGFTANTLAQVYRAATVSIGPEWCGYQYSDLRPFAEVRWAW